MSDAIGTGVNSSNSLPAFSGLIETKLKEAPFKSSVGADVHGKLSSMYVQAKGNPVAMARCFREVQGLAIALTCHTFPDSDTIGELHPLIEKGKGYEAYCLVRDQLTIIPTSRRGGYDEDGLSPDQTVSLDNDIEAATEFIQAQETQAAIAEAKAQAASSTGTIITGVPFGNSRS